MSSLATFCWMLLALVSEWHPSRLEQDIRASRGLVLACLLLNLNCRLCFTLRVLRQEALALGVCRRFIPWHPLVRGLNRVRMPSQILALPSVLLLGVHKLYHLPIMHKRLSLDHLIGWQEGTVSRRANHLALAFTSSLILSTHVLLLVSLVLL